ncbi:uncharacterized protein LOC132064221 [Lycium ferocissimum]|uniref:uncharacterized protein LOC132064221 n=1 Tax=Lycium ferocissimum TaxID=112874 RepID=UPI002815AF2D|nr:uncharacterized protein LOC132064221 [Lycium ferocissimum]
MEKELDIRVELSTTFYPQTNGLSEWTIQVRPWGIDLLRDSLDKVKLIQERLLTAQSRKSNYADRKVHELEFMVRERVFLKVSPLKGVIRFGKKDKFSPGFIGPFEIVQVIGEVASELSLPPDLSNVHLVFYVSMQKKYHSDGSHVIRWDSMLLDQNPASEKRPITILDRQQTASRIKFLKCKGVADPNNKKQFRPGLTEEEAEEQKLKIN